MKGGKILNIHSSLDFCSLSDVILMTKEKVASLTTVPFFYLVRMMAARDLSILF